MFHEYVLTLAFGFFYPVLCTMFGAIGCKYSLNSMIYYIKIKHLFYIVVLFMFWKPTKHSNFWNFMLWFSMLIGLGGLMCL